MRQSGGKRGVSVRIRVLTFVSTTVLLWLFDGVAFDYLSLLRHASLPFVHPGSDNAATPSDT